MISATTANPRSVQRHQLPTVTSLVITHSDGDGFSISPLGQIDFVAAEVEPPVARHQKRF